MMANRTYRQALQPLLADPALASLRANIDTSRWSQRRRNIVLDLLRNRVAECGHNTAYFVEQLAETINVPVAGFGKWTWAVPQKVIDPARLDAFAALQIAKSRLCVSRKDKNYSFNGWSQWWTEGRHQQFDSYYANSVGVFFGDIPTSDAVAEIREYLNPLTPKQQADLDALIATVESGGTVSILITP